jgi:hypothetical protein
MKKYKIGKFGKRGLDESYKDTYSIYKNPNEDLKKAIQNFKSDETTVEMDWPPQIWKIDAYEGDEVKCSYKKNVKYFPIEEVKEALEEQHLSKLNEQFPPEKYFKECFGVITSTYSDKDSYTLHRLDLVAGAGLLGGKIDNATSVNWYGNQDTFEIWSQEDEIKFEARVEGGSTMNLYFNTDGDFVNRDYNENLDEFKNKDIHPSIALEHFKKMLFLKIKGRLQHHNGKFYTNKFCYIPFCYKEEDDPNKIEFGVEIIPARDKEGMSFKAYGQPAIKRPKNTESKTVEDLYTHIVGQLTPKFVEVFGIVEHAEVPA